MKGVFMEDWERELIYEDLCRRLPYNPIVYTYDVACGDYDFALCESALGKFRTKTQVLIPYLRDLTDMTHEEIEELDEMGFSTQTGVFRNYQHLNPAFVGFLAHKEFDKKNNNIIKRYKFS